MGRIDHAVPPVSSVPIVKTVDEDDADDGPDMPPNVVHADATSMFPLVDAAPGRPSRAEQ